MKKINQEDLDILIHSHNLYNETVLTETPQGMKLVLQEIDFKDNDLSKLNFSGVYITSSLFCNKVFKNVSFGRAKLYDCKFDDVEFDNCNFAKTVFDYSKMENIKFLNSQLLVLDTYETIFKDIVLNKCKINSAFSSCYLENIEYDDCTFEPPEFWRCIIKNIKFCGENPPKSADMITEINAGTFENMNIISGDEAIKFITKYTTNLI